LSQRVEFPVNPQNRRHTYRKVQVGSLPRYGKGQEFLNLQRYPSFSV
jgi:hypothetical protein